MVEQLPAGRNEPAAQFRGKNAVEDSEKKNDCRYSAGRRAASGRFRGRAKVELLVHHLKGGFLAPPAAARHRQLALHFVQRAGTTIDDFANGAIGYRVADTDVHGVPSGVLQRYERIVFPNKNDCQSSARHA